MPASLRFIPGNTIRWRARRFIVVDYASMDAIIARELGKRAFRRIPIKEAVADLSPGDRRPVLESSGGSRGHVARKSRNDNSFSECRCS
jgi:hypothetical protein